MGYTEKERWQRWVAFYTGVAPKWGVIFAQLVSQLFSQLVSQSVMGQDLKYSILKLAKKASRDLKYKI